MASRLPADLGPLFASLAALWPLWPLWLLLLPLCRPCTKLIASSGRGSLVLPAAPTDRHRQLLTSQTSPVPPLPPAAPPVPAGFCPSCRAPTPLCNHLRLLRGRSPHTGEGELR